MHGDLKSRLAMYKEGQREQREQWKQQERQERSELRGQREQRPDACGSRGMKAAGREVADLLDCVLASNDRGTCVVVEERFPLSHVHGGFRLGSVKELDTRRLCPLCTNPDDICGLAAAAADGLVFLDTETTGLAGGTGTVAFLAGAGSFESGFFVIRQYFMRDYDEEQAMLVELDRLLSGASGIVTFNGKAFDWNLLTTRYIFNRMRMAHADPPHLDLLYPARRLWKLMLENVRLSSLERNILGEERQDDIPGSMIPAVYFEYLETRDASGIVKIIAHNRTDILSMVSLLLRMVKLLADPLKESAGDRELYGAGRTLEAAGESGATFDCYEGCFRSVDLHVKELAHRRLVRMYKRSGRYEEAAQKCVEMLDTQGAERLFSLIELAKYYEHREKDIRKALMAAEEAIRVLREDGIACGGIFEQLGERRERLARKADNDARRNTG